LIPVLFGPENQGNRGQIVDHRNGVAILGHIDGTQQVFTGLTGLDTDVRKLPGCVNTELLFAVFSAVRARYPEETPHMCAGIRPLSPFMQ
jgi:hypothetical protein